MFGTSLLYGKIKPPRFHEAVTEKDYALFAFFFAAIVLKYEFFCWVADHPNAKHHIIISISFLETKQKCNAIT